jgi:hypothetical protein
MNQKRKAEIQRQLSMARVPAPPDGLSDRIKADIPRYLLDPQKDRERLSRSIAFNLRVAAAILLLVSSAFVFVNILSRSETAQMASSDVTTTMVATKESAPPARNAAAAPQQMEGNRIALIQPQSASIPAAEVQIQLAEAAPRPEPTLRREQSAGRLRATSIVADASFNTAPPPAAPVPPPEEFVQAPRDERKDEGATGFAGGVTGGVTANAPLAKSAERETITVTAEAPVAIAPARATATSLIPSAQAAELDLGPHTSVFGISVEREAFHRVKDAIESGARPSAQNVDVEALVNYFAGAPKRAPREVRLELEGSPSPVANGARKAIVRFTVDTATVDVRDGGSIPPVASDAHLHIDFDSNAVASFRRIGDDDDQDASEPRLLANTSVTALYEIELNRSVLPKQRIATVRLRYRSIATGKERSVEETLRGNNFVRTWMAASPRHRLASLGAVWGESLKSASASTDTARKADVAKKAEELAMKEPKDDRARELAEVASASSRL